MDDYDYCYECGGYGDDYHLDENGDLKYDLCYSCTPKCDKYKERKEVQKSE